MSNREQPTRPKIARYDPARDRYVDDQSAGQSNAGAGQSNSDARRDDQYEESRRPESATRGPSAFGAQSTSYYPPTQTATQRYGDQQYGSQHHQSQQYRSQSDTQYRTRSFGSQQYGASQEETQQRGTQHYPAAQSQAVDDPHGLLPARQGGPVSSATPGLVDYLRSDRNSQPRWNRSKVELSQAEREVLRQRQEEAYKRRLADPNWRYSSYERPQDQAPTVYNRSEQTWPPTETYQQRQSTSQASATATTGFASADVTSDTTGAGRTESSSAGMGYEYLNHPQAHATASGGGDLPRVQHEYKRKPLESFSESSSEHAPRRKRKLKRKTEHEAEEDQEEESIDFPRDNKARK